MSTSAGSPSPPIRRRTSASQTPRRIQLRRYIAEHYEVRIAGLSPNARRRYLSQLRCHVLPRLGRLSLERIDAAVVQALLARLLQTKLSPASVSSVGRLLLRVLVVAQGEGFATSHIDARRLQWPRRQSVPQESRSFTASEVELILEASFGWVKVLFGVMAWSGLRVGEALGLAWSNLELRCGYPVMRVRQQSSHGQLRALKSHTSRADLPLDPRLAALLRDYWAACGHPAQGLVFGRYGAPRSAEGVASRHLAPLLRRHSELLHAGPHAFRHAFCTSCWVAGLDALTIKHLMRHSDIRMTLRYSHTTTAALRHGIERVSSAASGAP